MKTKRFYLFIIFFYLLLLKIELGADELCHQNLIVNGNDIYVISKFNGVDYFTTYNFSGDVVWEVPFNSEIVASKVENDLLLIFSKNRSGVAYYLTCLDPDKGNLLWEKAIFSPNLQE